MSDVVRRIAFESRAWQDYMAWRDEPHIWKKLNRLIEQIAKDPYSGSGSPKPLTGDLAGLWSRRITRVDRVTYDVTDDSVVIAQCRHHY